MASVLNVSSTCRWAGQISGARSDFRHPTRARDETVANSNSGNGNLRPKTSTARAANEPRRRPKRLIRPTDTAASRGNVVLFCGGGNHARTRGLPGEAEGIRTDGHRGHSEISSYSSVRPSMRSLIAARAFSIAINALASCRRGCYAAPGGPRRYAKIEPAPCPHCRPTFCLSGPQRSVWRGLSLKLAWAKVARPTIASSPVGADIAPHPWPPNPGGRERFGRYHHRQST